MIFFTIAFRIVTILSVLLIATLIISGRRPIGELPVFDLLTIVVIGAITGADIAEEEIPHLHIIFAIIITYSFQRIVNLLYVKFTWFKKLTTFRPMIIIQHGKLVYENMKKVNYTVDEVLMLLRIKNVFNIEDIHYGILEANGELSVFKTDAATAPIREDLLENVPVAPLSYTVIMDGQLEDNNLTLLDLTEEELKSLLIQQGYHSPKEIFFASMVKGGNLCISPYTLKSDTL